MLIRLLAPFFLCGLTACGTLNTYVSADGTTGQYARPIGNSTVTTRHTPYSDGLQCLGTYLRFGGVRPARIAVGRISDFTGKQELEGGFKVTQGASLMAMSALSKAGLVLVERFDTAVTELELRFANNKLIGDGEDGYRRIMAGDVEGSDFFLVGGITELNYNIRSSGVDAFAGSSSTTGAKGFVKANAYVMDISLDLRLVETRTLEVKDVVSYQKQIVGREVSAGVFDFFGSTLFDVSAGGSALEPIQYAVRTVIERAVLELMGGLYAVGPDLCTKPLKDEGLTLADAAAARDLERADPNRWHADRDLEPRRQAAGGKRAHLVDLTARKEGEGIAIVVETSAPVRYTPSALGGEVTLFGLDAPRKVVRVGRGDDLAAMVRIAPHGRDGRTAKLMVLAEDVQSVSGIVAEEVIDAEEGPARHRLTIRVSPATP